MILGVTFGVTLAAVGYTLFLPKTFTAVARILPPQQGQSTAAMLLGQIGGGLGGLAGGIGKGPSDLYIGMLKSETVADALIERFKLREVWKPKFLLEARGRLASSSTFTAEKGGIISIEVRERDPKLAADLANAYVEQLHKLTSTLAISEASQRRVFFEQQQQQAKEKLADAEVRLRQAIESGGLVSVDAQGRAVVEIMGRLRAQISAKEIQIGSMKAFAAPSNPDLQRAERELVAMRQELSRLEAGSPLEDVVDRKEAKGVGHIRLMRDVKYNEVLFEALAKQYELARVEEAREAPIVQVLDRAVQPEKASGPNRRLIVTLAAVCGFLAAMLFAFAKNALQTARQDPAFEGKLSALRAAWSRRKPE